jgi:photosystem II stability/assembly factor-like uncharacterized protein
VATPSDKDNGRPRRVSQILALGLIWGVGVLALVVEHAQSKRAPAKHPAASAVAAAAADVVVDVGRTQHDACSLQAVSFRTRDEGWVTDSCGRAFHTTDGGVSFATVPMGEHSLALMEGNTFGNLWLGMVTRIEWLSDARGVAFANDVRSDLTLVMITTDGGATWQRRPLPVAGTEMYYASDHFDDNVWVCGATGTIMRSRDGGAHFARTQRTPFNDDDRCMALSFTDADNGWAGGMDGTLYETRDGGNSWTRMEPPRAPRPTGATTTSGAPVYDLRVSGVVRLPTGFGWLAMEAESRDTGAWTYVTNDGGRTWREAEAQPAVAAQLAHGCVSGDRAVIARDVRLAFYEGEELLRVTPLLTAATSEREVIRGRETIGPDGHLAGWTDHAVIESFDEGRTWWTTARDGGRIRRVVHPGSPSTESRRALVELTDGQILTGRDELTSSRQPEFDRFVMDMTEALRLGTPVPAGPLSCLATAPIGRITLGLGRLSCFDSDEVTVHIAWTADRTALRVDADGTKHVASPERAISAAERVEVLRAIADAVQRPDDGDHGCTSSIDAKLEWSCGSAPPARASFDESNCAPSDSGPVHRLDEAIEKTFGGVELVSRRQPSP